MLVLLISVLVLALLVLLVLGLHRYQLSVAQSNADKHDPLPPLDNTSLDPNLPDLSFEDDMLERALPETASSPVTSGVRPNRESLAGAPQGGEHDQEDTRPVDPQEQKLRQEAREKTEILEPPAGESQRNLKDEDTEITLPDGVERAPHSASPDNRIVHETKPDAKVSGIPETGSPADFAQSQSPTLAEESPSQLQTTEQSTSEAGPESPRQPAAQSHIENSEFERQPASRADHKDGDNGTGPASASGPANESGAGVDKGIGGGGTRTAAQLAATETESEAEVSPQAVHTDDIGNRPADSVRVSDSTFGPAGQVDSGDDSLPPDSAGVDEGGFLDSWLDQIAELKKLDRLDDALRICQEQLPLWSAYQQASLILRARIKHLAQYGEDVNTELKGLYNLAAQASFLHDRVKGLPNLPLSQLKQVDLDEIAGLQMPYERIGFNELRLIKKTDIKLLLDNWGKPKAHIKPRELHSETWKSLIARRQTTLF